MMVRMARNEPSASKSGATDPVADPSDRHRQLDDIGEEECFDLLPVSYTHLDVYKRQAWELLAHSNS